MEITLAQYNKIRSFIIPTGSASAQRAKRLKFDLDIRTHLGLTRWEGTVDKRGFSGISLSSPTSNSPANLEIIWTNDGVIGNPLELDSLSISSLRDWLDTYNG